MLQLNYAISFLIFTCNFIRYTFVSYHNLHTKLLLLRLPTPQNQNQTNSLLPNMTQHKSYAT